MSTVSPGTKFTPHFSGKSDVNAEEESATAVSASIPSGIKTVDALGTETFSAIAPYGGFIPENPINLPSSRSPTPLIPTIAGNSAKIDYSQSVFLLSSFDQHFPMLLPSH